MPPRAALAGILLALAVAVALQPLPPHAQSIIDVGGGGVSNPSTNTVTPPVTNLPPIASGNSPIVSLLRQWWEEGTAAGNVGDHYENRDGGHSPFPLGDFPQATRWTTGMPTDPNDTGWGASRFVRSVVVVGNSSTAGSPPTGTSQARRLLTQPDNLAILDRQYRANNLYVYPEHLDHDPGVGGSGGWGDLFPANSPYVISSQGSSGSDLPFVRAAFASLAAFQPDTKRILATNGLLMPTFQMLLRSTATHLASPEDYFTGRAHPSVHDPANIDLVRLTQTAHAILPSEVPPLAELQVLSDLPTPLSPGVHYFDTNLVERLADAPGSVSRLWRGLHATRRMIVSAESSFDANRRPLTYRWAVLRGDPSRITIRPLNPQRSVVELTFEWAGRQPVPGNPNLGSSRQDVALFVSNGVWWSAPALVTWFASDQEVRSYGPDGRLLDVGYLGGGISAEIRTLTPFYQWLRRDPEHPGVRLVLEAAGTGLTSRLFAAESAILDAEALETSTLATNTLATTARNDAFAALSRAEELARSQGTDLNSAEIVALRADYNAKVAAATTAAAAYNAARTAAATTTEPTRQELVRFFRTLAEQPRFAQDYLPYLIPLWNGTTTSIRTFLNSAKTRLTGFGMISIGSDWSFRSTTTSPDFTAFERVLLADLNAKLIAQLIRPDGVTLRFLNHLADRSLFSPKDFRDVYQHDPSGNILGWRRFRPGLPAEDFTADGFLVLSRDPMGRPREAAGIDYVLPRQSGAASTTSGFLESRRNGRFYTYHYLNHLDPRGRAFENQ